VKSACLLVVGGMVACLPGFDSGGSENQQLNTPPEIVSVEVPEWPPLGPYGEIRIEVIDALITARDLGGMRHRVTVGNLLVDLGAPELEVSRQVLRADGVGDAGQLAVWVGDAWILGEVGVRFGGVELVERFFPGRPPGFGEQWDRALVTWSATEFPPGAGDAELWVKDAAGNETSQTLELVVDANPPEVEISSPSSGVELDGPFLVRAAAIDPEGEPVWLEVRVGGSFGAQAAGPTADVWLDTIDFAAGETTIEVSATDRAGNLSAAAEVAVTITSR
jgi:hypothetical protein